MKIKLHEIQKNKDNLPLIAYDKFLTATNDSIIRQNRKKRKLVRKDFHLYVLPEVKSWFQIILPDFLDLGVEILDIIHGFHHGTVIRDYLRSLFKSDFESSFPTFVVKVFPIEDGRTVLVFKRLEV